MYTVSMTPFFVSAFQGQLNKALRVIAKCRKVSLVDLLQLLESFIRELSIELVDGQARRWVVVELQAFID